MTLFPLRFLDLCAHAALSHGRLDLHTAAAAGRTAAPAIARHTRARSIQTATGLAELKRCSYRHTLTPTLAYHTHPQTDAMPPQNVQLMRDTLPSADALTGEWTRARECVHVYMTTTAPDLRWVGCAGVGDCGPLGLGVASERAGSEAGRPRCATYTRQDAVRTPLRARRPCPCPPFCLATDARPSRITTTISSRLARSVTHSLI